jgi:hypothetical protein
MTKEAQVALLFLNIQKRIMDMLVEIMITLQDEKKT